MLAWLQKKDGELNLKPSYQRDFVWKEPKSSRLIETILLKLPIQEMWLHEQQDEGLEVIDGQQRLTTIISFEEGRFADGTLFHLRVWTGRAGYFADASILLRTSKSITNSPPSCQV